MISVGVRIASATASKGEGAMRRTQTQVDGGANSSLDENGRLKGARSFTPLSETKTEIDGRGDFELYLAFFTACVTLGGRIDTDKHKKGIGCHRNPAWRRSRWRQ